LVTAVAQTSDDRYVGLVTLQPWPSVRSRRALTNKAAALSDGKVPPKVRGIGWSRDNIPDDAWRALRDLVMAAHVPRPTRFAELIRQDASLEVEAQLTAVRVRTYLAIILGGIVARRFGDAVTIENIHELANEIRPRYARLFATDRRGLTDLLLTVSGMATADHQVSGNRLSSYGSAALGSLLTDPRRELAQWRPVVADWLERHDQDLPDSILAPTCRVPRT
jgi:hypothetical protein